VVWLESEWTDAKIFYAYRSSAGTWSSAEMLFEYGYGFGGYGKEPLQLVTTSNGSVYLLWAYNAQIYCLVRPLHQGWLAPEIVSYKPDMLFRDPRAAADSDGTIHVSAYTTDDFGGNESITYLQRDNTGVWSRPIYLTDDFDYNFNNTGDRYTLVDGSGRVQVLWVDIRDYDMHYVLRAPNGSWSAPVNISEDLDYWDGTDLNKDLTADEEGTIFLAWVGLDDGGIRNVFFSQHRVYQDWSTPTRISDSSTNIVYPISLMPDAQGNVHVTWTTYNMSGGIYYTLKKPGQAWSAPLFLSQPANGAYSPELAVGLDGGIHIVWTEASGNDMWIAYAGPVLVPGSGNSSLSQVITVPITMTNPTLSCLYRLEGASAANGSDFNVLVSNGLTTTLLSTSENTTGWAHAWFDLTPWLSQTITLTFNVHEVEGYSYAWAYLDEVTLGSANPDVWVSPLGAPTALPGDTLTFQLSYGNRSPMAGAISATITATLPSGLIFESASITPTLNGNTLTWSVGDLPADSGPFTIQVTASVAGGTTLGSYLTVPVVITAATPELELVNNQEDYVLYIGSRVYLPLTVR
jgi:uncharacterized repeat protein (TIGR01451 family)